jgi:hypothetical protein
MAFAPQHPAPAAGLTGPDGTRPRPGRAGSWLAFAVVLAGSVLAGAACGLLWAALAPRAAFVVTSPGQANLVHAETSAFIAADACYLLVALAGGAVLGALGYLLAVRRFGPLPMAGVLLGATAAAFAARWSGQQAGLAAFHRALAASRPGTLLGAPVVLGARSAMAFWPLAACLVAGGLELRALLHHRSAAAREQLLPQQPAPPPGAGDQWPYPGAGAWSSGSRRRADLHLGAGRRGSGGDRHRGADDPGVVLEGGRHDPRPQPAQPRQELVRPLADPAADDDQ